jgi:hypothetical protein
MQRNYDLIGIAIVVVLAVLAVLLSSCVAPVADPTPTREVVTLEPTAPATEDIGWSSHFHCATTAARPEDCEVSRNPYLKGPYTTVVIEDAGGGAKRNAMVPASYDLVYTMGGQGAAFEIDCGTSGGFTDNTTACRVRMSDRDGRMGYRQEVATYADAWYVIAIEGTAAITGGRAELAVRVDDVYYTAEAVFPLRELSGAFKQAYVFSIPSPSMPGVGPLESETVVVTAELVAPYAVQGEVRLGRISIMAVPVGWGADVMVVLQ